MTKFCNEQLRLVAAGLQAPTVVRMIIFLDGGQHKVPQRGIPREAFDAHLRGFDGQGIEGIRFTAVAR